MEDKMVGTGVGGLDPLDSSFVLGEGDWIEQVAGEEGEAKGPEAGASVSGEAEEGVVGGVEGGEELKSIGDGGIGIGVGHEVDDLDAALALVDWDEVLKDVIDENDEEEEDWDWKHEPSLPDDEVGKREFAAPELDMGAPDQYATELEEVKEVLGYEPDLVNAAPEQEMWFSEKEYSGSDLNMSIETYSTGVVTKLGGRVQQKFGSVSEWLNLLAEPDGLESRLSDRLFKAKVADGESSKTITMQKADTLRLAYDGWPEGLSNIDKFTAKLKKVLSGVIKLPVTKYDVSGEMLDVGKWAAGEPEDFMVSWEGEQEVKSKAPKLIRIVATVDIASYDAAVARGAAVVSLTQMLELAGVRVQIDVHVGSNSIIDTTCRVKNYEDHVSMENLVMVLAHPAVFMHMIMGAWEHLDADTRRRCNGLGTQSYGWISEPPYDERGEVYISAVATAWTYSEQATLRWIVQTLNTCGIQMTEEAGQYLDVA